jgi:hypothetical protein
MENFLAVRVDSLVGRLYLNAPLSNSADTIPSSVPPFYLEAWSSLRLSAQCAVALLTFWGGKGFRLSNDGPKAKPGSNRKVKGQVLVPKTKKRSTRFQDRGQADYSSGIYKRESLFHILCRQGIPRLILRVVKERFCPGEGISNMAMQILNDFLNGQSNCRYNRSLWGGLEQANLYTDMFKRIATQAMKLMQQEKKVTLSKRAVRTAYVIKILCPSN